MTSPEIRSPSPSALHTSDVFSSQLLWKKIHRIMKIIGFFQFKYDFSMGRLRSRYVEIRWNHISSDWNDTVTLPIFFRCDFTECMIEDYRIHLLYGLGRSLTGPSSTSSTFHQGFTRHSKMSYYLLVYQMSQIFPAPLVHIRYVCIYIYYHL